MYNRWFIILVVVSALVAGQWQNGEALQTVSVVTRKHQLDRRHCDTFFHTRYVKTAHEYRAAVHGHIVMMVRNTSTHESTMQITNGRRLLKLHYKGHYGEPADVAVTCDLFPRQVTVASFLRQFGIDSWALDRDFSRGLCVDVDHILDDVGGSVVDPGEWNIDAINAGLRIARDEVQPKCDGDQEMTAVVEKLDEATSFATQQQQQQQQQQRRQERSAVRRNRRSVQIIMPGTQWCGDGNVSTDGQSHGNIIATDRCCQQHDSCSYTIGSFSRKYGLFNYRLHTISHCECDDVFRSCLRAVGSEEANMVGRLFFNVIGTKCFVIRVQRESQCVERSWPWGRCVREEMVNTEYAELRGPLTY